MAAAVATLIAPLSAWFLSVDQTVREPYLDEVFHVRQAQHYCAGNWHVWDPKITTPPGLYWLSFAFSKLLGCDLFGLRAINAVSLAALLLTVRTAYKIRNHERYEEGNRWVLFQHSARNIALFPPIFFFSALYYTDVLSTLFTLLFYIAFLSSYSPHASAWIGFAKLVALGTMSLMFRQTNIFWVAIFPAGIVLVRHLDQGHDVIKHSMERRIQGFGDSMWSIAKTSWKMEVVYDPTVKDAWLEDYVKTIISIVACLTKVATQPARLLRLVTALLPYLTLLALFSGFVLLNGGVVLGDKSNHVATLHLPQMLYIWPYMAFFSWPLIYPYLMLLPVSLAARMPAFHSMDPFLIFKRQNLPRSWSAALFVLAACVVVALNTIVHPFTLADNRHYTFYVFRLLLRPWWMRYAVTPVYVMLGWVCIEALGAGPAVRRQVKTQGPDTDEVVQQHQSSPQTGKDRLPPDGQHAATTSFVLIWLATSALQLITAPLVEPRYFILPWIFWRIHLPLGQLPKLHSRKHDNDKSSLSWWSLWEQYDHRLYLETIWMLAVNAVTGYIFLYWGFTWVQEPGKVQRFMW